MYGVRRVRSMTQAVAESFAVSGDVVVASAQTDGQQTVAGAPVRSGPRMSTRDWLRDASGQWRVILAQVTPIVPR